MFKFQLMQEVFYLLNNKIESSVIVSRLYSDNSLDPNDPALYDKCGTSIEYTCRNGRTFREQFVFDSKESLVQDLLDNKE